MFEDIKCDACGAVGLNEIEEGVPVRGHPNIEAKWLICECGNDIMEIE